jgi:metaxin
LAFANKCLQLYQLYLAPENAPLVHKLYVAPCSSHTLVQSAIAQQLRTAAETELVKSATTNIVSAPDLIREAEEAFEALSTLLEEERWFFGGRDPSLFDASVFAYTHLVLDESLGWELNPLKEALERHSNLVEHRERIVDEYFRARD